MDWLQGISRSLDYIEGHLEDELEIEVIAAQAYSSPSHFQRVFNLVAGVTVGEYIRNRRLSMAGRALQGGGSRVIDVAMRYGYDTSESFSKAFTRFHGITPSEARLSREALKFYYPLKISITVQGGFTMSQKFLSEFYWSKAVEKKELSAEEKYQVLVAWAQKARGCNPGVFDELTGWLLDGDEWTADKLEENEQIFVKGVLQRFRDQNSALRAYLRGLDASGVVNAAVYKALDHFDAALEGRELDEALAKAAARMFADFSVMADPAVRALIAGNKTGETGTDHVEIFGYVNCLKECDAAVQWALFMPEKVRKMQKDFYVESFEYKKLPAVRFIGREGMLHAEVAERKKIFKVLDGMSEYRSGFDFDLLFTHFGGENLDVCTEHILWGRLMKAGTPVPEGYTFIDLIEEDDGKQGAPFISQFAYAVYGGDRKAMHSREGYDDDALYDTTRNMILGQGVTIPYPSKYWNAEVYPDGCDKDCYAYIFCAKF